MKSIFVLFVSLFLISCVTPLQPTIVVDNDEFSKRTFVSLFYNDLTERSDRQRIAFNVYASISGVDTAYFLDLIYRSDKWLFIDKKQPAQIIVDGNLVNIGESINNLEDILFDGTIKETVTIFTQKSFIKSLSEANSIKIRLNGRYSFDSEFKQKNILALKSFCRRMKI